jgi:D-sedoheptulose 7-phosphate isomerase
MHLKTYLQETIENLNETIKSNVPSEMEKAISISLTAIEKNQIVIVAGNGGSMADAQHLVAELVNFFTLEHKPLPFLTLGVNPASASAWANDHEFDTQMLREFNAFSANCGALIVISTSGNSKNIQNLIKDAKKQRIPVIAFTSERAISNFEEMPDVILAVPVSQTARIQEMHVNLMHFFCEEIEKSLPSQ